MQKHSAVVHFGNKYVDTYLQKSYNNQIIFLRLEYYCIKINTDTDTKQKELMKLDLYYSIN